MINIFQQKYPVYHSQKQIWIAALSVAVSVYLFLIVFQPFGTYNYVHTNKYLLLTPYALIAFFLFFVGDSFITKHYCKWTLKNEIFKITVLLFFCSLLNYWYSLYFVNNANFDFKTLVYMVLFTYTLGIPVCVMYILGKYTFFKAVENKQSIFETDIKTEIILFIVPDIGEKINILKKDFLFAHSAGNYSHIFFLKDGVTEKKLLRISLKNLEKQIADNDIFRCHRSYILNIQNATGKQGNAQGYKISLQHSPEKVLVSRKYIGKILQIPL